MSKCVTVTVTVNAPSLATAEAAVRAELKKHGRRFASLEAVETADQRPDNEVAIFVTNPAGPRRTINVLVRSRAKD